MSNLGEFDAVFDVCRQIFDIVIRQLKA